MGALVAARSAAIGRHSGRGGRATGPAVLAALVCGWRGMLDEGDAYGAYQASGLAHLVAVSGAHLSIVGGLHDGGFAPRARAAGCRVRDRGRAALVLPRFVGCPGVGRARGGHGRRGHALVRGAPPPRRARGPLGLHRRMRLALADDGAFRLLRALGPLHARDRAVRGAGRVVGRIGGAPRPPRRGRGAFPHVRLERHGHAAVGCAVLPAAARGHGGERGSRGLCFPSCARRGSSHASSACRPAPLAAAHAGGDGRGGLHDGRRAGRSPPVPHASVPVSIPLSVALAASAGVAAALWLAWPRPRRRTLAAFAAASILAAACLVAVAPRLSGDEIVMLDVGQGDAFVVRSRGAAMLVDTGNQDRLLREALARHAVLRLDAVLVTHGDDDHMGSLASLRGVVEVDRVLVAEGVFSCGCEACERLLSDARSLVGEDGVVGLSQGDALRVGAFSLEVVWPAAFTEEGGNADSVCLLADADVDGDGARDWRTLFTGDAERDELRALIDAGLVGAVDVYKVGITARRTPSTTRWPLCSRPASRS